MIGVGGIRPSRGLSGKTDGFRTPGDRDFGSCGVLGRELVKQRHDLPDHVAHRVVARSRRGFANDALLKRIVFKIVRIRSSRPPDARRRWLEQHLDRRIRRLLARGVESPVDMYYIRDDERSVRGCRGAIAR